MKTSASVGRWVVAGALLVLTPLLGCSGGEDTSASGETPAAATGDPAAATAPAAPAAPTPEPEAPPTPAPAPAPVEVSAALAPATSGEWVDLLHTVATTVATTSVYRDELRQIGFLYDGDMETAWNSATMPEGDTSSRSLHVRLPAGVRVHAIDLTAGFTKVQGASDLFTGNRRLRRVRVRHPGGEVLVTLNPEERGLQRIPVEGGAGDWEIELLEWVAGSRPTWRELVISELRVWGEADASAPRASAPSAVIGTLPGAALPAGVAAGAEPAEGDEGQDAEDGGEDAEDGASGGGPVLAQRAGMHLTRLELAPEMDGRTPLEPRTSYSKTEDDQVFCYFELENPERVAATVTLAWEDANGGSRGAPTEIEVPANRRFLNYRYTSVSWRRPGTYSCVVRLDGEELGRIPFTVTP